MVRFCDCGYKFWLEHLWNGLEYVPLVYADEEGDSAQGQIVQSCPRCGQTIIPGKLLREWEQE